MFSNYIRKRKCLFSKVLCFLLIFQTISPSLTFAISSGPSQPEFSSFEPAGTSDMVNLFSGDFTYNIPLIEVPGPNGGYPLNLAYHSGITMEQESSWVGLGWTLNAGAVNRQMRGIPDEYNGGENSVQTKMFSKKPNWTVNLGATANLEILGAGKKSGNRRN